MHEAELNFPAVGAPSVDLACRAAAEAWEGFGRLPPSPASRGAWLDGAAEALDARRDEVLACCAQETALTIDELKPEFARMIGVLRLFAEAARSGAPARVAINPAAPAAIGPGHDIRGMLMPLGPVAVFGASNFPLAYGVCGGDTASALAAGCPVIVKEHPAHPRTGRLIAAIAAKALRAASAPSSTFGYLFHDNPLDLSIPESLVRNPAIRAVGFTGSQRGGLALDKLARERPSPIPVFAEMGSVNPVIITPGAMKARAGAIGKQLGESILLRWGQQCTCPGLVFFVDGPEARPLLEAFKTAFEAGGRRRMLAPWIAGAFRKGVEAIEAEIGKPFATSDAEAVESAQGERAVLFRTEVERFWSSHRLQEEVFGPCAVLVGAECWATLERAALPGSLTLTVHLDEHDPTDVELARRALQRHAAVAGRIVFNGVPTGVRASEAMVHGGPFPSTNRPDTTAVGPRAMERWMRPVCWQNAPAALLPAELR